MIDLVVAYLLLMLMVGAFVLIEQGTIFGEMGFYESVPVEVAVGGIKRYSIAQMFGGAMRSFKIEKAFNAIFRNTVAEYCTKP
jgi:hypothetical protein